MADIYFVPPSQWLDNSVVVLDKALKKRFFKVMRFSEGDEIVITDGRGRLATGILDEDKINIFHIEACEDDRLPIDVYLPLIKGERMEWAIAKLGEIGVRSITPVITERSVVKKFSDNKRERCSRLLASALEIRRLCWKTECREPRRLQDVLGNIDYYLDMNGQSLYNVNLRFPLSVIIGPEGGFSDDEKRSLESSGVKGISLGRAVLRAETAAIVGVSLIAFAGGVMM